MDEILDGGIPIGYLTELCGLADSGKTQLCLQLAINSVRNSENTVLYIDTKGDFSATRIQKILDANGCTHKVVDIDKSSNLFISGNIKQITVKLCTQ